MAAWSIAFSPDGIMLASGSEGVPDAAPLFALPGV
jgi:hypothetical protein